MLFSLSAALYCYIETEQVESDERKSCCRLLGCCLFALF